jgi:hypothetical protein
MARHSKRMVLSPLWEMLPESTPRGKNCLTTITPMTMTCENSKAPENILILSEVPERRSEKGADLLSGGLHTPPSALWSRFIEHCQQPCTVQEAHQSAPVHRSKSTLSESAPPSQPATSSRGPWPCLPLPCSSTLGQAGLSQQLFAEPKSASKMERRLRSYRMEGSPIIYKRIFSSAQPQDVPTSRDCWSCGSDSGTSSLFFCNQCGAIQPADHSVDYFRLLNM